MHVLRLWSVRLLLSGLLLSGAALAEPTAPSDLYQTSITRLGASDPAAVAQALRTLGNLGQVSAFQPILETLSKSADPEVRTAGLIALEKLDYTPAFLLEVLKRKDGLPVGRAYAAYTLGAMKSREAVPTLIDALADPDDQVRERAIDALGRIQDPRAYKPLILLVHRDPNPTLRQKAQSTVEGLTGSSSPRTDPETLTVQLKDPSVTRRREAAQALSQYGNYWSIKPLCVALDDSDAEVRRLAARALGDLQDRRAVIPLVQALPRLSGNARNTALIALGVLKDETAVDGMIKYLSDPDPLTRQLTARALGTLASAKAGPALVNALKDTLPTNRREAMRALGQVRDARAIPALIAAIPGDVEENQLEAVRAVGTIGGEAAVDPLLKLLQHEDPILVATAVGALRQTSSARAIAPLEQLARNHKDKYVREEALQASIELRGLQRRGQ